VLDLNKTTKATKNNVLKGPEPAKKDQKKRNNKILAAPKLSFTLMIVSETGSE
jgi:hypothetical protein